MNIKDLEYFRIVCQQKSITKAAHLLYMTPQGLSRIMKNVENELDAVLFVRTGAGIQLTESGNYLYERLPALLDSYQGICSEIRCIEQRKNHEIDLLSAYGILRLVRISGDSILRFSCITGSTRTGRWSGCSRRARAMWPFWWGRAASPI